MNEEKVKKLKEKIISSDFIVQISAFFKKIRNQDYDFELSKKTVVFMSGIILGVIFSDQLTKFIADTKLMEMQSYEIIDNFFYFTYVHNEGMAWSMLDGARWLFLCVTPIAIAGMVYFFFNTKKHEILTRYGLVLAFSGAIGNYIDRLSLGYVRDFIQFYIFGYDFPIFNVADIAIVIGIGMIILEIFIQEYQIWKLSKTL